MPWEPLNAEQLEIRELVRTLARDRIAPRAAEIDESHEFPWDVVELYREHGIFGLLFDEAYGGTGTGTGGFDVGTDGGVAGASKVGLDGSSRRIRSRSALDPSRSPCPARAYARTRTDWTCSGRFSRVKEARFTPSAVLPRRPRRTRDRQRVVPRTRTR